MRNIIARGKRERSEARRPWLIIQKRDRGLKGRNRTRCISPFQGSTPWEDVIQGRRASRCSALAPGCHIARRWRWASEAKSKASSEAKSKASSEAESKASSEAKSKASSEAKLARATHSQSLYVSLHNFTQIAGALGVLYMWRVLNCTGCFRAGFFYWECRSCWRRFF